MHFAKYGYTRRCELITRAPAGGATDETDEPKTKELT